MSTRLKIWLAGDEMINGMLIGYRYPCAAAVLSLLITATISFQINNIADFSDIDNIAYWLSYRYWVEGVDLAGDIDYVRPILSPGILLYPFALLFDHPPHAVWAFNATAHLLASFTLYRYGRTMGLSERGALITVILSALAPSFHLVGLSMFALAMLLWVLSYLNTKRLLYGAAFIPFTLFPLINPPFALVAAAFGMFHLSAFPISKRIGIAAMIICASSIGAIIFVLSTPQTTFEYCGVNTSAWWALVVSGVGFLVYRLAPDYLPNKALLGFSVSIVLLLGFSPVEYHAVKTALWKSVFVAIPILLVYGMLWRNMSVKILMGAIILLTLSSAVVNFSHNAKPTDSERVNDVVMSPPYTRGLHDVLTARNAHDSTDYLPVHKDCWHH